VCAALPAAADPAYQAELTKWREKREARLRADDGWLAVAGLYWLEPGISRFGADPDGEIVFPAGSAPAIAGTLEHRDRKTVLRAAPGVAMVVNGAPLTTSKELRPDTSGEPDVVKMGRLTFFLIERGGKVGLRLRDLERPQRKAFKGLSWFPVREELRITTRLVPHAQRKTVPVPNVLGQEVPMESPGKAVFTVNGKTVELDALLEEPGSDSLFFVFSDATSGKATYPGGRFLYTPLPVDGKVVLDFNRAYSPPCAFTDFATCPLPPPQNRLQVAIEAGEKYTRMH
jgi:uncharacterized protein (DUF1684 family)